MAAFTTPSLLTLPKEGCALDAVIGEVERRLILEALERTGGIRTAAAKLLGISFRSFRYRLEKQGLDSGDSGDPREAPESQQPNDATAATEATETGER